MSKNKHECLQRPRNHHHQTESRENGCCPHCGYCKHCGRGPTTYDFQHHYVWRPQPWPGDWHPTYPWSGNSYTVVDTDILTGNTSTVTNPDMSNVSNTLTA